MIRTCAALVMLVFALFANAKSANATFDRSHAAWNLLLKQHVVVSPSSNASTVDYAAFAAKPAALNTYLAALSAVPSTEYRSWPKQEQLAFLINAYNAFTVAKVLQRYPNLRSIRDFGTFFGNFGFGNPWKDPFFKLFDKPTTLDDIEQKMIRAPGVFDDPRTHFALNCASIGCPMLREEAYTGVRLNEQLDAQALRFLSDRSRNRYAGGKLEISKIFDWYGKDFSAGHKGIQSVQAFLGQHAAQLADRPDDQNKVRNGALPLRYLDYDWSLNRVRP